MESSMLFSIFYFRMTDEKNHIINSSHHTNPCYILDLKNRHISRFFGHTTLFYVNTNQFAPFFGFIVIKSRVHTFLKFYEKKTTSEKSN
jgi:hypothetical protein